MLCFFFPLSITDPFFIHLDIVLSIDPSSNVFDFGYFVVHLKDWLTYSGGTDRPGEIYDSFSILSMPYVLHS